MLPIPEFTKPLLNLNRTEKTSHSALLEVSIPCRIVWIRFAFYLGVPSNRRPICEVEPHFRWSSPATG